MPVACPPLGYTWSSAFTLARPSASEYSTDPIENLSGAVMAMKVAGDFVAEIFS